jgi:hypothetical protein
MGGNLTMYVAGSDARVKAASPSVGGSGFRTYSRYGLPPQIRNVKGDLELFRRTMGYQFYAPRITAPLLHLGASNDFHGQMDATGAQVKKTLIRSLLSEAKSVLTSLTTVIVIDRF